MQEVVLANGNEGSSDAYFGINNHFSGSSCNTHFERWNLGMRKKAKLSLETLGKLIVLAAFLVIVISIGIVIFNDLSGAGPVTFDDIACKVSVPISVVIRDVLKITSVDPLCPVEVVDEPLIGEADEVMRQVANYMTRCWWLYGEGEFDDLGKTTGDETFTCYVFEMGEDIDLEVFIKYLKTHRKGRVLDSNDLKDSDWNYLQSGYGNNICFDRKIFESDNKKFKQKSVYYVKFRDDKQKAGGNNDLITVSRDPEFGNFGSFAHFVRESLPVIKDLWSACYDVRYL